MASLIRSAILAEERRPLTLGRHCATPADASSTVPPPAIPAAMDASSPVDDGARQAEEAAKLAELRTALRREAESARSKAEQEGYAAGHAKGSADAHEALREKVERFSDLVESAGNAFAADIDSLEEVAVGIAFAAVCKILGRTLPTAEGVRAAVGEVLKQAKDSEKLMVRLAPGDFYLLLQQQSEQGMERSAPNVELIPDERVSMGGCILETSGGSLDGRIETQMEMLRTVLLQARHEQVGGGARP